MSAVHEQLDLASLERMAAAPGRHVGPYPEPTIAQAFARFHADNPRVYDELRELALRWRARGMTRCGIGMLFEVCRWRSGMRTGGDDFRLNNNYRALYARLLMRREPELDGLFELRELHTRPEGDG